MANSVPLGQAGTGAAVILNGNRATDNFLNTLEGLKNQKALQQKQAALQAQKQAEQLAQSYRDNALKARTGTLYADQLSKIEGEYINEGLEAARRGENLYDPNNPNAQTYAEKRRNIESLREYAKRNEELYNDVLKNANEYDPEDLNNINEFVKGDINSQFRAGATLPTIQKRFNIDKALTGVKATTVFDERVVGGDKINKTFIDRPATEKAIIANIASNEGGERFLNRLTKGMPITEIQRLPKTKEDIKKELEENFKGQGNEFKAEMASKGIVEGTDNYDRYIDSQAEQMYSIKKNFNDAMDNWVSKTSAGVQTGQRVNPTISDYQRYQMNKGDGDSNTQNYSVTPKVFSSTAEKNTVNEAGERVAVKNPKVVSRTADKFVGSDPTTSSLPQIEKAWNVTKGGVQKFPAGDINITGVGYFRVKDGYQKLVTANDKNGNEWLFKESDVPVEAKNSKGFRNANKALGGEPADWRSNKEESGANKKAASGYKIGQVDGGYKYTGGDPTKQENWIKQ